MLGTAGTRTLYWRNDVRCPTSPRSKHCLAQLREVGLDRVVGDGVQLPLTSLLCLGASLLELAGVGAWPRELALVFLPGSTRVVVDPEALPCDRAGKPVRRLVERPVLLVHSEA